VNKLNVLKVEFEFNGIIDAIYPVILWDDNEMILIDCGYPNFLTLIEESAIKKAEQLIKNETGKDLVIIAWEKNMSNNVNENTHH